jgi:hypothetical protein
MCFEIVLSAFHMADWYPTGTVLDWTLPTSHGT